MDSAAIKVRRLVIILLTVIASVAASPQEDLVSQLPGVSALNTKIYAGYVTVDETNGRALFYYFVEAQNNSLDKPLTMWLNGGPGCSSVGVGAFTETGPFTMQGDVPVINPYSWNHQSNMLYVESPAGVGFSYSNTTSDYYDNTDERTAQDSFNFLQGWVQKFPEYKDRSFYLAGESYAGHYIPGLAALLVMNKATSGLQLKGVMMGNPTIDILVDVGLLAEVFYLWTHGQVSDDTAAAVSNVCKELENNITFDSPACNEALSTAFLFETGPIDVYNVLSDTCNDDLAGYRKQSSLLQNFKMQTLFSRLSSTKFKVPDPCNFDKTIPYLNRKDVQAALHARLVNESRPWDTCADDFDYDIPLNRTQPVLKYLLENDVRVWVYSGDQDSLVPMTATRTIVNEFAEELEWNITSPYQPWFSENQIGGWTLTYNTSLLYTTVRGSGHMVPLDQPVRGLQLFKSFLEGTNLPLAIK